MNWTSISTVIFVWFLILVLSISYVCLFLPVLYDQSQTYFYGTTISCAILVLIGSISYLKAIWTSPGYPDKNLKVQYVDHIDDLKRRAEQQKQFKNLRKKNKLTRQINMYRMPQIHSQQVSHLLQDSWCQKCDNVKQTRAHHCKICKTCIERMDHHCPWVGNCIGKHNHKYFILFLFYKTIALAIVSFTILIDYIDSESPILTRIYQRDELYYIIILVTGMMSIMLFMAIGFLLVTQIMMVGQNLTTVQTFYDEIRQNNPFDKDSFIQNVKEITGQSFWFFPTKPFPSHQDQINVAFTQQG